MCNNSTRSHTPVEHAMPHFGAGITGISDHQSDHNYFQRLLFQRVLLDVQQQNEDLRQAVQHAHLAEQHARVVIHDVKNALTAIKSCTEILSACDLTPSERIEFIQALDHEIDRVVEMTKEFTSFSGTDCQHVTSEECSVVAMVQDVVTSMTFVLAQQHITITLDLRYAGTIHIGRTNMQRVLRNLLDNARDAMPDGGVVTISSQIINNTVQLEVRDTGCGMSPELQARCLEPFVTYGKPHGTGLGMAIVKDILDQHHARLEVQSAVGQGTTIRMLFPRRPN